MRIRNALLVSALVAASPLAAIQPAAAIGGVVQPGDYIETDVGGCTLNFLFDGIGSNAGKVYFATAAHCVEKVGEDIRDINGRVWGDVAFIGNQGRTATDYAFVQVRPGIAVSPAMKGYPQYPTGVTTAAETAAGDLIQQSGYGTAYSFTRPTQEERVGVLASDTAEVWRFVGAMDFGDSGGPLVHIRTGKALGIESRICLGICTDEGPTIEGMLAKTATSFPVRLRTV